MTAIEWAGLLLKGAPRPNAGNVFSTVLPRLRLAMSTPVNSNDRSNQGTDYWRTRPSICGRTFQLSLHPRRADFGRGGTAPPAPRGGPSSSSMHSL